MRKSLRYSLGSLLLVSLAYACSDAELLVNDSDFDGLGGSDGDGSGNATGSGARPSVDFGGNENGNGSGAANGNGAENGNGAGGVTDVADASYPDTSFEYEPHEGNGGACATVTGEAVNQKRPIDIIISIDNSGSMQGEIQAVEDRINLDFVPILEDPANDVDYQVIMVSRYGYITQALPGDSNYGVCIHDPLGAMSIGQCTTNPAPQLVNNPNKFYQHSTDIGSNNMWCRLIDTFDVSDEYPEARNGWAPVMPNGWGAVLRENAFKVFIGITDDDPEIKSDAGGDNQQCDNGTGYTNNQAGADNFDADLRALSAAQFEDNGNRNYAWYSIVGMSAKNGTPTVPYEPNEAVVTSVCTNGGGNNDGVGAGQGYQRLSIMTDALRYSSCLNSDFNAIFEAIAQGVVEQAAVPCQYDLPPVEGTINVDNIDIAYQPGGGGDPISFDRVTDENACAGQEYYLDNEDTPTQLFLCPAACTLVQSDPDAELNIDFGCLGS